MIDIPPEVLVPASILQGSIYHYRLERVNNDGTQYKGDRFFIVLNVNPKADPFLVLVTLTTKIQKQEEFVSKTGEEPETLVKISRADFANLSQDSAVNCNTTYTLTLDELVAKVENGGKNFFSPLPKSILIN